MAKGEIKTWRDQKWEVGQVSLF